MPHQHVTVSVIKGNTLKVQTHIIAFFKTTKKKTRAHIGSRENFAK
jgi:hypothetical protein